MYRILGHGREFHDRGAAAFMRALRLLLTEYSTARVITVSMDLGNVLGQKGFGAKAKGRVPLSESDERNIRKYGKLSHGGLSAQQSKVLRYLEYGLLRCVLTNDRKERTYFDWGDFALSAADRMTDNGAIKTDRVHPNRHGIGVVVDETLGADRSVH
ncbi:hypothetical protein N7465_011881 [Penicillium sp. CMV-2018d]|nr:hypothetical protein N7465_011881 [Penicillium sp. CMV-2018d]